MIPRRVPKMRSIIAAVPAAGCHPAGAIGEQGGGRIKYRQGPEHSGSRSLNRPLCVQKGIVLYAGSCSPAT